MGHTCASCASWSSSTMAVAVSILGEPKVEGVASGSDRPASLRRSHFPFDLIRGPGPTALGQPRDLGQSLLPSLRQYSMTGISRRRRICFVNHLI